MYHVGFDRSVGSLFVCFLSGDKPLSGVFAARAKFHTRESGRLKK